MFREKEICNAIRTAYLYLFPDKKERKRALSRLNMELVAQSVRYRGPNDPRSKGKPTDPLRNQGRILTGNEYQIGRAHV